MRFVLFLCVLPLLAACGDDPKPGSGTPSALEVWHFAPAELARSISAREPGALAWIPAGVLAKTDVTDARQLKVLTELLSKTVVPRLALAADGTFILDLRAEQPGGAWRTVKATGTWREEGEALRLAVSKRASLSLAPLEIADELTVRRRGALLLLEAMGRTIPLTQRDL